MNKLYSVGLFNINFNYFKTLKVINVRYLSSDVKEVSSIISNSFKYSDLIVEELDSSSLKKKPDLKNLQFGRHFTDHMLKIEFDGLVGQWGKPLICKFGNLSLHPAAKVFHYAIELFEGLKAYRGFDNKIRIFRPELNMLRMNVSAERSDLPQFDSGELIKCIKRLIRIDKDWVPECSKELASLYIRPTIIGTEPTLGIASSNSALLYVILTPVGSYFKNSGVTLWADPRFIRAWPGGVGNIKMGSNYAPTVHVQNKALNQGHQQVLWLYGDNCQITEAGTMNLFMVIINDNNEKELITPLKDGLILPGITRQSILELTRDWNTIKVTERNITLPEIISLNNKGRLLEMFGAGTACVVSPISGIWFQNKMIEIPTLQQKGSLSDKILNELIDIQYGRIDHSWTQIIE